MRRESASRTVFTLVLLLVIFFFLGKAFAKASPLELTQERIHFWERVAQCEEGGNWHQQGKTFQGGTGIYAPNWDWWARELGVPYRDAADAPKIVQIRVADYGYRVHNGGWGCITNHLI